MTNHKLQYKSIGVSLIIAILFIDGLLGATQAAPLFNWSNGQAADVVQGQTDFNNNTANAGGVSASTLANPSSVAVDLATGKLFVSDSVNHRVLRYSSVVSATNGSAAEAVFGQADFISTGFNRTNTNVPAANSLYFPGGIAVDSGGRLWVVDATNTRVLRFDNAASKATGADADGVLGQPDFTSAGSGTTASTMFGPSSLTIDSAGTLWVVESTNNRVLRFDNAAAKGNGSPANGVLGQADFNTGTLQAVGQGTFNFPLHVHADSGGRLWVGDTGNNRVLRFDNAATKANGANADGVLGQINFINTGTNITQSTLNFNFVGGAMTSDDSGSLYVSDSGNNRILIFNNASSKANGADADKVLGQMNFMSGAANGGGTASASVLSQPGGLFFQKSGSYLWAADNSNHRVLRYKLTYTIYLPIILKPGWAKQASGVAQQLNGVSCPSSSTCFAVGNSGTIIATTNGGDTWATQTSGTSGTLHDVSCKDTQTCIAVGDGGTIIGTTNGGTTWSGRSSNTSQILRGVGCSGSACLAAGGAATSEGDFSADSGATWSQAKLGNTDLYDADCPNSGTCTVVGDGGRAITFAGTAIIGGGRGLHNSLTVNRFTRLDCPSDQICFVVGMNGTIFKTSDGGLSWSQQTSSTTVHLAGVSCNSTSECFAVGDGGKIITTSNGTTWADDALNGTGVVANLKAVSCVSGRCFAVGATGTVMRR